MTLYANSKDEIINGNSNYKPLARWSMQERKANIIRYILKMGYIYTTLSIYVIYDNGYNTTLFHVTSNYNEDYL